MRRLYRELSETWHATVPSPKALYIPQAAETRPFPAPPQLVRHAPESPHYDWVIMTDCGPDSATLPVARFLLEYLLEINAFVGVFHWPDYQQLQAMDHGFLKQAGVNPLDHYLLHGGSEGREPGPEFETALYLENCPRARQSGEAPLLHYIKTGRALGCAAMCPERAGAVARQEGRPTILVCAHAAERQRMWS